MKIVAAAVFALLFSTTVSCLAAGTPDAGSAASGGTATVTVNVKDLSPKFLTFFSAVEQERPDADRRWELWKKLYGFAAVPPTPEGEQLARTLLEGAWPRYPAAMRQIRLGAAGMSPQPQATMDSVAALLRPEKPAAVTLLAFVGGFDHNAFTAGQDGRVMVAVPVEMDPGERERTMAHEFTHAVQIAMGSFSGGWERSIGTTVLTEGLATRATERLFPGRAAKDYVEMTPGWLDEATKRRREILRGIRPHLESAKSEDVMRFTLGKGASGLEREAYYAGWEVVGYWLRQGMSFADIARIPEKEMPARVGAAIDAILSTP